MATVAEVKLRALQELGVIRVGQSAQDKDNVQAQDSYDEIYSALKILSLATWTSAGDIPDEVVPHVVALVAINRNVAYGISDKRFARLQALAAGAIPGIRALVNPKYESLADADDF